MFNRVTLHLVCLSLSGLVSSGCDTHEPATPLEFAIFLTEPGFEVQGGINSSVDIDSVGLVMHPLITLDDIEWYDWDEHRISLTDRGRNRLAEQEFRQPFVLSVMGERVYGGVFWASYFSSVAIGVTLDIAFAQAGSNTAWLSHYSIDGEPPDLRSDSRVRRIMEAAGKLR